VALELTPQQQQTLDEIHDSFLHWCDHLGIKPVDVKAFATAEVFPDPAI
jgi:hypothetical protein